MPRCNHPPPSIGQSEMVWRQSTKLSLSSIVHWLIAPQMVHGHESETSTHVNGSMMLGYLDIAVPFRSANPTARSLGVSASQVTDSVAESKRSIDRRALQAVRERGCRPSVPCGWGMQSPYRVHDRHGAPAGCYGRCVVVMNTWATAPPPG